MNTHIRILDLFSGIGGFSLGLERAGMETVAFCENDEPCRKVLKKHWPDIPIYNDVRTLTGEQLEKDGITDIGLICGGYPCQPFSVAGKRQGEEDNRHLWPEAFRLVKELRPDWCLFENVAGHINMGLDSVLADLESEDYSCQTFIIPACAVGAPHRRDRVWIVVYSNSIRIQRKRPKQSSAGIMQRSENVADSKLTGSRKDSARSDRRGSQTEPETLQQEDRTAHAGNSREGGSSLANSASERCREAGTGIGRSEKWSAGSGAAPNTSSQGLSERQGIPGMEGETNARLQRETVAICGGRSPECRLGRSDDGIRAWLDGSWEDGIDRVAKSVPGRVDRLKQLGNAVVPQIPEIIGRAIMEIT